MSLGVLGTETRAVGGLVAVAADCWDAPGFKACHTKAWEKARLACKPSRVNPVTFELVWSDPNAATYYANNPQGTEAKCIEYVDPIYTVDQCSNLCPKKKPNPAPAEAPPEEPAPARGPSGKVIVVGAIALLGLYVFMKEK